MTVAAALTVALWGAGVLATLAIGARVLRRRTATWIWAPAGLAALAVCAGDAPAAFGSRAPAGAAAWLLGAATPVLLVVSVMALVRLHQRVALLRAGLDVAAGALIVVAVVLAATLVPVQRATGLDASAAALLLTVPAFCVLVALVATVGLRVAGAMTTVRARLVVGALWVLVAAESAQALLEVGALPAGAGAHQAGVALALALLAAASWAPAPPVVPVDEPGRAVMIGPAVELVAAGAILGVDHAVGLPTGVVVLALCVMAVALVSVLLVYRLITSLNDSQHQARTDELTGLGNRRALGAALAGVASGERVALTVVDLDRFKEVNDVLGHHAGDELLRQVAARLLHGPGTGEVVVRQGGDEFALVHPGVSATRAADRAEHLVDALAAPFVLGGRQVCVAASIGVAGAPEHAGSAEELLQAADIAMYRAKAAGSGVVVYDAAADAERRADLRLLADLRDAVARESLDVHYQPQLDAATGAMVGIEALVRWQHPTRGMLPPALFLPLAERDGLMDDLTRQVLGRALASKDVIDGGGGSRMSVNVSATCLLDPHLVTTVGALLLEHGVPPAELMLEITETELMLDAAVSRRVVAELVGLGVGVSIDDYGTGHSSLSYLKDLPASELKLDRSFVAELGSDPRIATIVRSTVDLAHSLGLRLVAEGVEDEQTLDRLVALGVDVTQGYHHSRPVPAQELARWAAQRRSALHAG